MTEVTVKRDSGGGVSFDPNQVNVQPEGTVTWTRGDSNMKLTGFEFVGGSSDGFVVEAPEGGGARLAVRATGAKTGDYPYKIQYTDGKKSGEGAGTVRLTASAR